MPQSRDNRPVRVLHLLKGLGPGGAEHLILNAARVRDRARFDYRVAYLLPWKDDLVERIEGEGVPAHCLSGAEPRDPRWLSRLRHLVQTERPDVVHLHSPLVAAMARPALRAMRPSIRPAIVSTEHNVWSSHDPMTRRANHATFRIGDRWLAVSSQVREALPPRLQDRVEVVVHGLVLEDAKALRNQRRAVRSELGIDDSEVVSITIANLRRQKAYPDLLIAAKAVTDRHKNVRFLAVGQGPLEGELRAMHQQLELGDRFQFLGYRPDALRVATGADLFVLASDFEGYPIAVMEAMALGLPIVATDVGAMADAVADGRSGIIVKPGQPEKLADSIEKLVIDADLRTAMGRCGLDRAEAYDIRHAVTRTEQIYDEVSRSVASART